MPPPMLPKNAAALAGIVGDEVIDITRRQSTSVSTSDCIRGVYKAMKSQLSVISYDFPKLVADQAHVGEDAWDNGHREGFCRACAAIYAAVCQAMTVNDEVGDR